jgi:hypothetical protein
LQQDWPALEAQRQEKWLEVAARFPAMQADERERIQQRMAEWARMTPKQRTRARLQYQEAQWLPGPERQVHWQAYQALSDEEKRALALRAKPAARAASAPQAGTAQARSSPEAGTGKRNLVKPAAVQMPRAVTPTTVQAKPGATTTSIAKRAAPPAHHQAGLPKIVATPGFVDPATMLPQRGPQGAAVRSAAVTSTSHPPQ